MDIVEALDSLEHRLYALRDRASRNLKTEPLKEEAKAESKTLAFNSLKSRTDELSRSSIHVLKHYAQMNPSYIFSSEKRKLLLNHSDSFPSINFSLQTKHL